MAALLAHLRNHRSAGEEHAEHVDIHDLAPLLDGDLLEGPHGQ
jgi:hypothetical protein